MPEQIASHNPEENIEKTKVEQKIILLAKDAALFLKHLGITDLTNTEWLYLRNETKKTIELDNAYQESIDSIYAAAQEASKIDEQNSAKILQQAEYDVSNLIQRSPQTAQEIAYGWLENYLGIEIKPGGGADGALHESLPIKTESITQDEELIKYIQSKLHKRRTEGATSDLN